MLFVEWDSTFLLLMIIILKIALFYPCLKILMIFIPVYINLILGKIAGINFQILAGFSFTLTFVRYTLLLEGKLIEQ